MCWGLGRQKLLRCLHFYFIRIRKKDFLKKCPKLICHSWSYKWLSAKVWEDEKYHGIKMHIGLGSKVFANVSGDRGSMPGRVIPKTQKMVLDTSPFNTQHYKVRIKGQWSTHTPARIHTHAHTRMHIHTCTHTFGEFFFSCTHTHTHAHTCIYIRTHTHALTYKHAHGGAWDIMVIIGEFWLHFP